MISICTAAALAALFQQPADLPKATHFPRPEHVLFDEIEGVHWALGHTYKANVSSGGLRYWPLSGLDATEPIELSLRLEGLRVGGASVHLPAGAAPSRETKPATHRAANGGSISIDRGPVTETYLFDVTSVEQTFEIDLQRLFPGERAGFCVDIEIRSTHLSSEESRPPFLFRDVAGRSAQPLIQISKAFALGAARAKIPLEARRTSTGFSIEVPASLARSAGDVLVIDPVISSGLVTESNLQLDVIADVAAVGDEYFVAVQRQVLPGDHDVSIYRVGRSGPLQATFVAFMDISTSDYTEPAIAGLSETGELVVAATRGSGVLRRIFVRRFTTAGATTSAPYSVWNTSSEAYEPDLGSESGGPSLDRRFCLVFTEVVFGQTGTVALILDRAGAIAGGPLYLDGFEQAEAPAVSNGTGRPLPLAPQAFRVAQKRIGGGGAESIWAAEISRSGAYLTSPWKIADAQNTGRISIASANEQRLADGSSPYVVTWDSGLTLQRDVYLAMCVGNEIRGEIANLNLMSDDRRTFDQAAPSVAVTRSHWLVTYQERQLPFGEWETYLCTGGLTESGAGLAERNQRLLVSPDPQVNVTVATLYDGGTSGSGGDQGLAIWTNAKTGGAIDGARIAPPSFEVAGAQYCFANANSTGARAWLVADGSRSVADAHTLRCTDAPPMAPCYILTSATTAFVQNVGGGSGNLCLGGSGFGRFASGVAPVSAAGLYSLQFDPSLIAQPNGTVSAAPGETWYFQAWFRDADGGGTPTSNLSNGVAIEFTQ